MAGYSPVYVTLDQACEYLRAKQDSRIASSVFDPVTQALTTVLTGQADVATQFMVFTEQSGEVQQSWAGVPPFMGSTQVTRQLTPGTTPTLDAVSAAPSSAVLQAGATVQLRATGSYSDGSLQDLTALVAWASSSPAVVTVDAGGIATAVGGGGRDHHRDVRRRDRLLQPDGHACALVRRGDTGERGAPRGSYLAARRDRHVRRWQHLDRADGHAGDAVVDHRHPGKPVRCRRWNPPVHCGRHLLERHHRRPDGPGHLDILGPATATIAASGVATAVDAGTTTISAVLSGVTGVTTLTVTAPTLASVALAAPGVVEGDGTTARSR